jgi:methylated-DNA-[protein]-cysteine S-methyltransferase
MNDVPDALARVIDPSPTPDSPRAAATLRRPLAGNPARAARAAVAQARIDSPLGGITLAATARGLCGLWFDGQQHHPGRLDAPVDPAQRFLAMAIRELEAYWRGHPAPRPHPSVRSIGARRPAAAPAPASSGFGMPVDLVGTPFQRAVWTALRRIEPGRTATYGEVAQACGHAAAVRAVGVAIGRNPVSIIVPCHRVVGANGALTGYAGGLDRKRRLLELEAARATARGA